jgi:hypothetical protein
MDQDQQGPDGQRQHRDVPQKQFVERRREHEQDRVVEQVLAAAPSHTTGAHAEPCAVRTIAATSTGTASTPTTNAVPRAEPFIAAVPVRIPDSKNVSAPATTATTTGQPDNQYAAPTPDCLSRVAFGCVVTIARHHLGSDPVKDHRATP